MYINHYYIFFLSLANTHTHNQECTPFCDCLSQSTCHTLHHSAGLRCQDHLGDKESPLPPAGDTSSIYNLFLLQYLFCFLFCILSIYVKHLMTFAAEKLHCYTSELIVLSAHIEPKTLMLSQKFCMQIQIRFWRTFSLLLSAVSWCTNKFYKVQI